MMVEVIILNNISTNVKSNLKNAIKDKVIVLLLEKVGLRNIQIIILYFPMRI